MENLKYIIALIIMISVASCNKVEIEPVASRLQVVAPAQMLTGHCTSWTINLTNKNNKPVVASKASVVNLTLTSVYSAIEGAEVFSDSNCANPISQITIAKGSSSTTVYTKYNLIKNLELTASLSGIDSASDEITTSSQHTKLERLAGSREEWGNFDGVGDDARIPSLVGITNDGTYLYVATAGDHTIVRVNIATRQTMTVAGSYEEGATTDGIGSAARLNNPTGLVVLGDYLYITERSGHTIRKMDLDTFEVTTVAGSGGLAGTTDGIGSVARFNSCTGIATDGTYLYVSDTANNLIRRVDPVSTQVMTIAGTGAAGSANGIGTLASFNYPFHLSTDADGDFLYIPDGLSHTIRQLEISSNTVTTIAGTAGAAGTTDGIGALARFNTPHSAKYDDGFLYISDYNNNLFRKIDLSNNEVTTLAGIAGSPLYYTDGPFLSSIFARPVDATILNDVIYTTEWWGGTIRKLDLNSQLTSRFIGFTEANAWSTVDGPGKDARFNWIDSFETDGTYLYIPDWGGNVIRRMSLVTKVVETIAGLAETAGSADGIGSAARFDRPMGLAIGGGFLYISERANVIRKMNLSTGAVATLAGLSGAAGGSDGLGAIARFNNPGGMALNGNDLYVLDHDGKVIRKVNATTGAVLTVAGSYGLAATTDGIGTAARLAGPYGATILNGYLYFAENMGHTIRKMDLTTYEVTTVAGLGGTPGYVDGIGATARLYQPYRITSDGTNLYVSEMRNHTLRKVNPITGEVSTFAGQGPKIFADRDSEIATATFAWPSAILWTPAGIYYSNDGINVGWIH